MSDIIYFAKLRPNAVIPSKRNEDGAYDIYACFDEEEIVIQPHEIKMIPTGIASAFDPKYRIVFHERGSTSLYGLRVGAGLIDSGFRGEWFVVLNNTGHKTVTLSKKHKKITEYYDAVYYPYNKAICQAKIQEVPKVNIQETTYEELLQFKSERGTGALGSSNK